MSNWEHQSTCSSGGASDGWRDRIRGSWWEGETGRGRGRGKERKEVWSVKSVMCGTHLWCRILKSTPTILPQAIGLRVGYRWD